MKGIVDRFEGDYAVVEVAGVTRDIAKTEVEESVKPGDVVEFIGGKWVKGVADTKSRTKKIGKLMNDVWED
jgi:hydrogenase maturation factor